TIDVTARRRAERTLAAQYAVTSALMESETLDQAGPRILESIGTLCGCAAAAIWTVDELSNVLRCAQTWQAGGTDAREFETVTRGMTFEPGVGLPGRVWTAGVPSWIEDVLADANFPRRAAAAAASLHGAFALPILFKQHVVGVFEFFSHAPGIPDADMLR